jgi:hypothetical protein
MRIYFKIFFHILAVASLPAFAKTSVSTVEAAEMVPSSQCYFIPPEKWEVSDPRSLSPKVKIAFLKKNSSGFCPSINLAVEETDASSSEYLKAVKAIHEQDRANQWRALGKVRTGAGNAQLTEIDSTSEWGPVRILQLILVKEGRAYVMTAAALKEDISKYYKDFQTSFRSFTLTSDLFSNIPQTDRRQTLKQQQIDLLAASEKFLQTQKKSPMEDEKFKEEHWLPFQKSVLNDFGDMGTFWQILVLRNANEKLISYQDAQ